jgi:predicted N-acyltransferase
VCVFRRTGIQYHWANQGYASFDDFLMALKQSKRNNIRKARLLLTSL